MKSIPCNWQPYEDRYGDSGISAIAYEPQGLRVLFRRGPRRQVLYTARSSGMQHLIRMAELARTGNGLNAYINRHGVPCAWQA